MYPHVGTCIRHVCLTTSLKRRRGQGGTGSMEYWGECFFAGGLEGEFFCFLVVGGSLHYIGVLI